MKKYSCFLFFVIVATSFLVPDRKPMIFLVGDSTMANKPIQGNPERGWGQLFADYFNEEILIQNTAVNGKSTKSFINEHRWDSVMKQLHEGDFVMIQFGHNDSKIEDSNRYAAPHSEYKNNLIRFVRDVRSVGATPILITPVMRRKFDDNGAFVDQHGDYPDVVRALADSLKVYCIDLHKASRELIEKEGVEGSKKLFLHIPANHFSNYKGKPEDNTHFSEYGAGCVASLVCQKIVDQQLPLTRYLKQSEFASKYVFQLPQVYVPHFKKDTFNIVDFGAKPDGFTLSGAAINQAIEKCSQQGGGTVLVPSGSFLTGPIVLKSNVNLHLTKSSLIIFTSDFSKYPLMLSSFEGVNAARCQSPILAENVENIAITGEGIMDGNGYFWRPLKKDKVTETEWNNHLKKYGGVTTADHKMWFSSEKALKGYTDNNIGKLTGGKKLEDFESVKDFLRPNMVRVVNCKNILIQDITFQNSPAWTTHFMLSEHISVKGLKVKNPWYGTNTDAIDLESCHHVQLEDCVFDTGDDGITIKSGRDEEGRKRGVPTSEVIVRNCTVYRSHGGFVIGSEMSGGVKNLYISNCTFIGSDIGLRFKTVRGRGGVVENIYASNINMKDIVSEAVFFDMYYSAKDPVALAGEKRELPKVEFKSVDETTPVFKNFYLKNLTCNGASKGIFIRGIPEMPVENIFIENAVLQSQQGVYVEEAKNIHLKHLNVQCVNTDPVVRIVNASGVEMDDMNFTDSAQVLLQLDGDRTKDIFYLNGFANLARKKLVVGEGVVSNAVSWEKTSPVVEDKRKKKRKTKHAN